MEKNNGRTILQRNIRRIVGTNMKELIDELTKQVESNYHYRGRNRRSDYVIFYFTDDYDNIVNIKITHEQIEKQDYSPLIEYIKK